MADDDSLEGAAGVWLQRLHSRSKLPSKGTLEMLRRREVSAKKRAEDLADAERRCCTLAQERLLDERNVRAWREESLELALAEARRALEAERLLRASAEAAAAEATEEKRRSELALSTEVSLHNDARRSLDAAKRDVAELRAMIDDDASLRALDALTEKLEAQRADSAALRRRFDIQAEEAAETSKTLQRLRAEFAQARGNWAEERQSLACKHEKFARECAMERSNLVRGREQVVLERDQVVLERDFAVQECLRLSAELQELQEAGATLQAAAEATITACAGSDEFDGGYLAMPEVMQPDLSMPEVMQPDLLMMMSEAIMASGSQH